MKKMKLICFLLLAFNAIFAQTEDLPKKVVEGKTVYIYKIQSGDGWYSIARKFNITYSELKMANKKTDKLKAGATLNIPSKLKANDPFYEKNKLDENQANKKSDQKKITHKVAASETLFSISKKYNVTVDQIKRNNNLKSNSIKKGQLLVISEVKKSNSDEVGKSTEVKHTPAHVEVEPAKEVTPSKADVDNSEPKTKETKEVTENKVVKETNENVRSDDEDKKIIFANGRQEINETGVASWIEDETSGSNKYYALHRTAPAGTIIKITNRMNSRSIYVKVVGLLPSTGDNEGLIIKVSKSGAEKLGVIDQRFQANLLYGISVSK